MAYALGRRVEDYDQPTIRAIATRRRDRTATVFSSIHHGCREQQCIPHASALNPSAATQARKSKRLYNPSSRETRPCTSSLARALPRRTFLRGLGATVALPYLDAMVPAFGALRQAVAARAVAGRTRRDSSRIESVHGAAGSNAWGATKNLWAPAGVGRNFELIADGALPSARAVAEVSDDRQQHRRAHGRSVRRAGDRRRPLPVERGVPHAVASEADAGLRSLRRHVDRSDHRAPHRPGHGDSVDAALHRESRSGRRLLLQLRLRLHGHDQLGEPDRAAADDPQPARRVRPAVRRRQRTTPTALRVARRTRAFSIGSRARSRASSASSAPPIAQRLDKYLEDIRELERRIQAVEARNSSGEARELPEAPAGVPDSFEEHMKLMFDFQVLAFQSDMTRVFSFKTGRDASSRAYPGERHEQGLPPGVAPRRPRGGDSRLQPDQPYHVSMLPYFLDKLKNTHGRRQEPARQDDDHVRLADGRRQPAQPSPLPAPPARARRTARSQGNMHLKAPDGTPMANVMLSLHAQARASTT